MSNIVLILGEFHKDKVDLMREAAHGTAKQENLEIGREVWVPGSFEVPLVLKKVFSQGNVDAAVLLGIIERGETKHGLVMAQSVMDSVLDLELEFMKPVGKGILGPEILPEQMDLRLKPYAESAVKSVAKMLKF